MKDIFSSFILRECQNMIWWLQSSNTALRTFLELSHLSPQNTTMRYCSHSHFTENEIEAQIFCNLPNVLVRLGYKQDV